MTYSSAPVSKGFSIEDTIRDLEAQADREIEMLYNLIKQQDFVGGFVSFLDGKLTILCTGKDSHLAMMKGKNVSIPIDGLGEFKSVLKSWDERHDVREMMFEVRPQLELLKGKSRELQEARLERSNFNKTLHELIGFFSNNKRAIESIVGSDLTELGQAKEIIGGNNAISFKLIAPNTYSIGFAIDGKVACTYEHGEHGLRARGGVRLEKPLPPLSTVLMDLDLRSRIVYKDLSRPISHLPSFAGFSDNQIKDFCSAFTPLMFKYQKLLGLKEEETRGSARAGSSPFIAAGQTISSPPQPKADGGAGKEKNDPFGGATGLAGTSAAPSAASVGKRGESIDPDTLDFALLGFSSPRTAAKR